MLASAAVGARNTTTIATVSSHPCTYACKIKCTQSESFAIIGYEPSIAALGGVGRLLLAARRGHELVYVGGVGTGFNHTNGTALRKQMERLIIEKPTVAMPERKRTYRWIRPELIAEIAFRGWTDDGKLRHASYKGAGRC